jgi:ACS family glucarate transporter-like MFS transporter
MTAMPMQISGNSQPPTELRPTGVRWRIMILIAVVNMLPSLGKINLGVAAQYIQAEFRFSSTTMGWILGAFVFSYAVLQLPAGIAGDRYGPRKVLTGAILWYSIFLAAMAIVPSLPAARWLGLAWSFALIQVLIGAGEGFTPPNSAKIVGSWMSSGKVGLGISFTTLGIGLGGAVTPVFIAWTMQHWGWRTSFWLCGLIGIMVAIAWAWYVTDRPGQNRHVNSAELQLLGPREERSHREPTREPARGRPPWKQIFSSTSVWSLLLSYTCRAYTLYFFNTSFFTYLVRARGLTVIRGGLWGATPFLAILLLSPIGGWVSDVAARKLGKRRGRQTAVWIGMACSAVCVWAGSSASSNTVAILLVGAGAGFNMFANVTWWATCVDLSPNYAASLSGLMNMFGGLSGALAPILTAYISSRFGWSQALNFIALLSLVAGFLWLFVKADERLEPASVEALVRDEAVL